jgi:hypothetical protein
VTTVNSIGMISSFGELLRHPSEQKTSKSTNNTMCALVEMVKERLE